MMESSLLDRLMVFQMLMGPLHKNGINRALPNWKDSPLKKFLTVQGNFGKIIDVVGENYVL